MIFLPVYYFLWSIAKLSPSQQSPIWAPPLPLLWTQSWAKDQSWPLWACQLILIALAPLTEFYLAELSLGPLQTFHQSQACATPNSTPCTISYIYSSYIIPLTSIRFLILREFLSMLAVWTGHLPGPSPDALLASLLLRLNRKIGWKTYYLLFIQYI